MFWLIWVMLGMLYFCSNCIYTILVHKDCVMYDKRWKNVLLTISMLLFGTPIIILYIIGGIVYITVEAIKERKG